MAGVCESIVTTNQGIQVQDASLCRLCHREGQVLYEDLRDRLFGAPGLWASLRCTHCGLIWVNPRPVLKDIGKLYIHYYTHGTNVSEPGILSGVWNAVLSTRLGYQGLRSNPVASMVANMISPIRLIREMVEMSVMTLEGWKTGNLLEVGCGNGQFLAKMRTLGWEVTGVEPDREATKIAREHFGLRIYEGVLEEASFPDETFDAIIMNHVFEHLWNPVETLRECCRVLRSGGKIVIVTPNIKSLGHRIFSKSWLALDPPRHLHLFSIRSLQICAEQVGLRVLRLRSTSRGARQNFTSSYLIWRKGALCGGSVSKWNSFRLWFGGQILKAVEEAMCGFTNVGEELILIATK